MAQKSILLAVAEPQALLDITQAVGPEWEAAWVSSEEEAFAQLEKRAFDALLVDFNFSPSDGSELLNQALEKHPELMRFLLAYEADLALVAAKVTEPYQILPKPLEPKSLKSRLENALATRKPNGDEPAGEVTSAQNPQPEIPSVYAEVLKALESPGVTNEQVGELIAADSTMTAELLGLTHSAYLGLPRNITEPVEAVGSLGLETVKALVMSLQFLAEHGKLKPGYLSLEQLWRHSTKVAQLARDLVLFETRDRSLATAALTAGLVHDLGKIVLATNFDDLYGRVHSLARKQPVPLWEIEKEIFGANHGEIGGCLVGMWNLAPAVVEATALHHEPPVGEQTELTPLAAVHVANVLAHELWPGNEGFVAPTIHTAFLNDVGLLPRLPVWRAAIANRTIANPKRKAGRAARKQPASIPPVPSVAPPPRSANYLGEPGPETQTGTFAPATAPEQPAGSTFDSRSKLWLYVGAAAALLTLVALWRSTQSEPNSPEPVYARTTLAEPSALNAPAEAPASVSPEPAAEVAARPALEQPVATSRPVGTNLTAISPPPTVLPATNATPSAASQTTVTNITLPHATSTPHAAPQPEFRVHAIIYNSTRPCALINGQSVCVGDKISGATVLAIGRTNVLLQVKGQPKTYALR